MHFSDNFSSWLLMPSRQDIFYFFYFPPSIVFTYHRDGGICDDKWVWPLAFVCRYHVADQNTHIQFFVALLMILPQTGNHYWIHLQLEVSGHHQT